MPYLVLRDYSSFVIPGLNPASVLWELDGTLSLEGRNSAESAFLLAKVIGRGAQGLDGWARRINMDEIAVKFASRKMGQVVNFNFIPITVTHHMERPRSSPL